MSEPLLPQTSVAYESESNLYSQVAESPHETEGVKVVTVEASAGVVMESVGGVVSGVAVVMKV